MTILDDIRAHKVVELAARERQRPLAEVKAACEDAPAARSLPHALKAAAQANGIGLIAEVKRRSPAAGVLRADADAPLLACTYASAGAAAISVLTDERFFGGADADLRAVRAKVDAPVLRKDFTLSPYQIYEARSLGADVVLLIASLLDDEQISSFLGIVGELGMSAIVEVHSQAETERAVAVGAPIIGINNRDLSTFTVDLGTTERLRSRIPKETIVISESGISCRADVERAQQAGAQAILVGEALLRAEDPAAKVRELLGR